ncbi:uncharacterized protein LOC126906315 isoform X2 [Daktulosphaira vitifoliae]|nr:uncharacterized protein LOC126906315 isoform X2 [Daktulosphaira vitifoliae]
MAENKISIIFVNCIGSDIHLWKKKPNDIDYEWQTCIQYEEPEYQIDEQSDINSLWKFYDHITKRYLHGNGKNIFQCDKTQSFPIRVEIKTPLYSLKELCMYTVATRILVNNCEDAIDDIEIPEELKKELKYYVKHLELMYEQDGDCCIYDWTIHHEDNYNEKLNK